MTTAGEMAINEARALRLVLASITGGYDSEGSIQISQKVFDEIDCVECMETVTTVSRQPSRRGSD